MQCQTPHSGTNPSHGEPQVSTQLSGGPLRALRVLYYRIFVSKAPPRRFGTTSFRWRLIVGDTLFVSFVLATSLVTFALGSTATMPAVRGILVR
jgi:hypothetical protein